MEAERLTKDLLDRVRAEIIYAENKAAILLAGVLAAVGGITAAMTGEKFPVTRQPVYIAVPFWAAVSLVLAGIVGLALVIYPRLVSHKSERLASLAFFGDVVTVGSPAQLRRLIDASPDDLIDIWVDQIWQSSLIANLKYQYVCWSLRLFACALLFSIIAGACVAFSVH
jgi:hypothetical protein